MRLLTDAYADERRHPFVLGGILPCDIDLPSRGEHPYHCRTHGVGFRVRTYVHSWLDDKAATRDNHDLCPVARLEAWKARRGNLAEALMPR